MKTTLSIGSFALLAVLLAAPAPVEASVQQYDWAYLFAGQSQRLEIDVGPNAVVFALRDITVSGQPAADARAAIDGLQGVGNGDGELTATEVADFEGLAAATINSLLPQHFGFDLVTIDGKVAYVPDETEQTKISLDTLHVKGAEGPVTSQEPILTDLGAKLRFESVDQTRTRHEVRFENVYGDFTGTDTSDVPPAEVVVRGYRSWAIDADSIQPAMFQDRLADDTLTFGNSDMAYFDEAGEGLVFAMHGDPSVRVDETTRGSPGAAPLMLVGVLGLLGLVVRRRL